MGLFGMDDNEMERMLATHPLTVFSKLVADNPGNKVYEQCLDNEIRSAAETLAENIGLEQISFIEHIFGAVPDGLEKVAKLDGEIKDLMLDVKVVRRILAEARRIKNG